MDRNEEIHLACLNKECNGSIVFTGVKDGINYYKCCICLTEFPNRRKKIFPVTTPYAYTINANGSVTIGAPTTTPVVTPAPAPSGS